MMHGYAQHSQFGYRHTPQAALYILQDTFTDTDGTLLGSHSPDVDTVGGGWLQAGSNFEVRGNRAKFIADTTAKAAYLDVGENLVDISFDFDRDGGDFHGVYFASEAGVSGAYPANGWFVERSQDRGEWNLNKRVSGSNTRVSAYPTAATENTVRIVTSAGNIKVYLDGTLRIDYSASITYYGTHIGLKGGTVGSVFWDNLTVNAS